MAKMTLNEALSIFGQTELDPDLRDGSRPDVDELRLTTSPHFFHGGYGGDLVAGFVSGHSSNDSVAYGGECDVKAWERGFEAGRVCREAGL